MEKILHQPIAVLELLRNIDPYPFQNTLSEHDRAELLSVLEDILQKKFPAFHPLETISLQEAFFFSHLPHRIYGHQTKPMYLSLLGEDHLHIVSLCEKESMETTYEDILAIENSLAHDFTFSFSEKFGYLTQSIENVGSSLKTKIMYYLPFATDLWHGRSKKLSFNEISLPFDYYENGNSLGVSEKILLKAARKKMEELHQYGTEKEQQWLEKHHIEIKDQVFRSLAILQHALNINPTDVEEHAPRLLFGLSRGWLTNISFQDIIKLYDSLIFDPSFSSETCRQLFQKITVVG